LRFGLSRNEKYVSMLGDWRFMRGKKALREIADSPGARRRRGACRSSFMSMTFSEKRFPLPAAMA
jgi:hypothetical protein